MKKIYLILSLMLMLLLSACIGEQEADASEKEIDCNVLFNTRPGVIKKITVPEPKNVNQFEQELGRADATAEDINAAVEALEEIGRRESEIRKAFKASRNTCPNAVQAEASDILVGCTDPNTGITCVRSHKTTDSVRNKPTCDILGFDGTAATCPNYCDRVYMKHLEEGELGVTEWVRVQIEAFLNSAGETIYKTIAGSRDFQITINAAFVLAVMLYGAALMLGMAQSSPYNVFLLMLKILLVYNFALNWDVFQEYVIGTFEGFVNDLTHIVSTVFVPEQAQRANAIIGASSVQDLTETKDGVKQTFEMADFYISMLFSRETWAFLDAITTTGPSGIAYGMFLFIMIAGYVVAILRAISLFIIAMIIRYMLYAVAPLFLTFALFNQTKTLFDGWIEQIISFSLQPVFIFAIIGLMHTIMQFFFLSIIPEAESGCTIEWTKAESASAKETGVYKFRIKNEEGQHVFMDDLPINFWAIAALMIVSGILFQMVDWVMQFASRISGGFVEASQFPVYGWQGRNGARNLGMRALQNLNPLPRSRR